MIEKVNDKIMGKNERNLQKRGKSFRQKNKWKEEVIGEIDQNEEKSNLIQKRK